MIKYLFKLILLLERKSSRFSRSNERVLYQGKKETKVDSCQDPEVNRAEQIFEKRVSE